MISLYKSALRRVVVRFLLGLDRLSPERGIPILQYHRVCDQFHSGRDVTTVFPWDFAWQMDWLRQQGYEVVTLDEIVERLDQDHAEDYKCVALTFDDGHRDNFLFAYPILKARGLRATVFIVTDYVGCSGWLNRSRGWCDEKPETGAVVQFLSWDELRQMSDVFDIGSHGRTHRDLTMLSRDEIQTELKTKKIKLEWYRYEITQLTNGAVAVMLYGDEK